MDTRNDRPWFREDNKVEFESDGLRCVMRRGPLGSWCGYVAVPKTHPWFGKNYSDTIKPSPDMLGSRDANDHSVIDLLCAALSTTDISEKCPISLALRAHGGITFAGSDWPIKEPDLWWFGFDCAHSGDMIPGIDREWQEGIYRDQAYVVAECQALAAQLVRIIA